LRLKGKRALVTAAGQGIGRAVAEAFAREGASVVAVDIDARLLSQTTGYETAALDLTDPAAIAALPARTGAIDVLFNGAGMVHSGTALDCTEEEWAAAFNLNCTAAYRLIRAFLPGMIEAGGGSIINTSSVASSIIGVRNRFAYGVTKAAVIGLTKSVAADFVGQGIRCNAICPGTVETPSLLQRVEENARATGVSIEQSYAGFVGRQPMGRLGTAAEIAAAAVYLASDESAFTTGTTMIVDGGWTVE
jgi:2-keto-3-deoxy-L-fuconate dehydrogenase